MAAVFSFPLPGTPSAVGYQLSFFQAGTATPQDVWTDSDLSIAWAQPIVFNADGNPDGPIYLSPTPALKVVYLDANSVAVPGYPVDDVSPYAVGV
jgi:hypothetical protein